jgi:cation transporter-like permease
MFDYIFALFHLILLLGVFGYAVYSLLQGNVLRFTLISVCLVGYYFLALHKNVRKEIERKRKKE